MRKTFLALLILISISITANAQGKFGIGLILGEPSGLSGKFFLSKTSAIDGAIGVSFGKYKSTQIHGDYLQHITFSSMQLPLYYGIGARIKLGDDKDNPETRVGIRIPVGISWMPEQVPIDLFLEIVPLLDLSPTADFSFNGAVGIRYYFN